MDAIRELQRQLKAAQQATNTKKISERNCMDLVQKLVELGHIKLFHTSSGKEWLTPEQLDREVREALANSGGRLQVAELPNELGVGIEHCENRVEQLRKKDRSLVRIHGELLSAEYLQNIAQEVEESLAETSCLAVSDLAARYNLPAEFVRSSVLTLIGASTSCTIKQNTIYSAAYAARMEARVRGALRGCTQPVSFAQLAARHSLDPDMLTAAVQKLLKSGVIRGKLQGATFTPHEYSEALVLKVDNFFSVNEYLPMSLVKTLGVSMKEWTQSKQVEGVILNTVFLSAQLAELTLASISEGLAAKNIVDAQQLLPTSFLDADARELLEHLAGGKKLPANTFVVGCVVVNQEFVDGVASSLDKEVEAAAERKITAPAAAKSAKKNAPAADADSDDDGGGSKKKGKRGARGKKGRADNGDDDHPAKGGGGSASTSGSGIDNQVIMDLLERDHPDVPVDVCEELCEHVQKTLAARVAKAQAALQSTFQSKQKVQFEQVERLVQQRYEALVLGYRALEAKGMLDSPLYQYLLREVITEPLHGLLAFRWEEASGASMEVTAANRKQCLDKLAGKLGAEGAEKLSRLVAALSKGKEAKDPKEAKEPKDAKEAKAQKGAKAGKEAKGGKEARGDDAARDSADVTDLYHAAAEDCHIYCRRVDKKREKSALQEQRAELRQRLKELASADRVEILQIGLRVALLQDGVPGLVFPADAWALQLVAQCLGSEETAAKAAALCESIDKGEDPVALEGAVSAWKEWALTCK